MVRETMISQKENGRERERGKEEDREEIPESQGRSHISGLKYICSVRLYLVAHSDGSDHHWQDGGNKPRRDQRGRKQP